MAGAPGPVIKMKRNCIECNVEFNHTYRRRCDDCYLVYRSKVVETKLTPKVCSRCNNTRRGSGFVRKLLSEDWTVCFNCRKSEYLKNHPEVRAKKTESAKSLRNSTPERQERERAKQRRNHDKEKAAAYYREKGKLNSSSSYNRIKNDPERLDQRRRYNREHRKRRSDLAKAGCAKRRAAKLLRTPKWANLKVIRQFYIDCPEGMVVDHIVPLQGKEVCGLHVENNLQYLTKSENSSKGNKLLVNNGVS